MSSSRGDSRVHDGKDEVNMVPSRIVFGSCNSHYYPQRMWPAVASREAAAFVWGGDAIYGDSKTYEGTKKIEEAATPAKLQRLYQDLLTSPDYARLIRDNEKMTVLGTMDDHDYGLNNGDAEFIYRKESGQAFLDFIQKSSPLTDLSLPLERVNAGKGVYSVKVFDFTRPVGQQLLSDAEAGLDPAFAAHTTPLSDKSVALFLLDVRTNKTPWKRTSDKRYQLDYEGDYLGEEQWAWFEQALGRSTAKVNIVVQGLQVHTNRFTDGSVVEDWSRYPRSQFRLYQTLLQPNVQSPILVSGDVHMSEFLLKTCRRLSPDAADTVPRPLVEVTASGMSHSWGTNVCARPDESLACKNPYIRAAFRTAMHFAHYNYAWREVIYTTEAQEGAKSGYQYSLDINFGEFEFDWERQQVTTRILGKDVGHAPLLSMTWDFDTLSGLDNTNNNKQLPLAKVPDLSDFARIRERLTPHGASDSDWYCVSYRGDPSTFLQTFGYVAPISLILFLVSLPFTMPILLACVLMRPVVKRKKTPQ